MRQPVLICLILIRRDWRNTPAAQQINRPIGVKNLLILYVIAADDLAPFGKGSILQMGPCIPWGRLITENGYMFSQNFEIFTKLQRLNVCEISYARHCHNITVELTQYWCHYYVEITSFQCNNCINITLYVSTEKSYWSFAVIMVTSYWFHVSSKPSFTRKIPLKNFPCMCSAEEWRFDMFNTDNIPGEIGQCHSQNTVLRFIICDFKF